MIIRFLYAILSLTFALNLEAHQSALSYLQIVQNDKNEIKLTLKKPLADINSDDIEIVLPKSCHEITPRSMQRTKGYIIYKKILKCSKRGLKGSVIKVKNLLRSDKGVVFDYISDEIKISNKLITANEPFVKIRNETPGFRLSAYFGLGVGHILSGADHLLFVLTLLLLVANPKTLIQTVTAFTIAHSITLSLAISGYLDIKTAFIETLIALSIVFVARETIVKNDAKTLTQRYPWIVAFVFGLFHGLGFANALFEIGIPQENIALSLLFFNTGVETGQILFIMVSLLCIKVVNKTDKGYNDSIRLFTGYATGIVSTYWFIERLFIMI